MIKKIFLILSIVLIVGSVCYAAIISDITRSPVTGVVQTPTGMAAAGGGWILDDGTWDDTKVWGDTETWTD